MRGKLTTKQVVRAVGVTRATLQAWIAAGRIAAPEPVIVHGKATRLWTSSEVKMLRKFKGTLRPGPKKEKKR